MNRVAIKVTFGEQLPSDIEDLEMLEDEKILSTIELKSAKFVAE